MFYVLCFNDLYDSKVKKTQRVSLIINDDITEAQQNQHLKCSFHQK
jgi:hypothetical protein